MAVGYRHLAGWGAAAGEGWAGDVTGVAVDDADRVHVLRNTYPQVTVLNAAGDLVARWGDHDLSVRPHFITICGPRLLITDDGGHRVFIYDLDGQRQEVLGSGLPAATGYDVSNGRPQAAALAGLIPAGPFNRPTKAVAQGDAIYVTDGYRNCRLHRFDGARAIRSWGTAGTASGQFMVPHSLVIDAQGRILVCDRENDRVQIFAADGAVIGMWENVQRPTDIVTDGAGHFYLSELPRGPSDLPSFRLGPAAAYLAGRVTKRDAAGRIIDEIRCDGVAFLAPHAVAVDRSGAVYVSEVPRSFGGYNGTQLQLDSCLRKFEPLSL